MGTIPYELAVGEDFNLGNGSVTVTNPAGGTHTGSKIGIHTFLGTLIVSAADFAGADGGAKINAADAALGASAGEIWVTPAVGTTWSTNVSISTNHNLRLFGPATYNIGANGAGVAISLATNCYLFGNGPQSCILKANSGFTGTMVKSTPAITTANVGIQGVKIDGNSFSATIGIDISCEFTSFIKDVTIWQINSANNTNPVSTSTAGGALYIHDCQGLQMENVIVAQSGGDGLRIVDSWGVVGHGIFCERPAYNASGAIVNGKGAAFSVTRNTETNTLCSSNSINGMHIEWEAEVTDARDAVLIDGADHTIIQNLSVNPTNANTIVNAVRVINTSAVAGHLAYAIDGLRVLQGTVTNLINDTINSRTLPTATFGGRWLRFESIGQGTAPYGSYLVGQPTAQPVEFGMWHLAAASAPWSMMANSDASWQLGVRGNTAAIKFTSSNGTTFGGSIAGITMSGAINQKIGSALSGATPSVAGGNIFTLSNGGATNCTNFTGGTAGQVIHLLAGNSNTTLKQGAGVLQLAGQADFNILVRSTITLYYDGTTWWELGRSVN